MAYYKVSQVIKMRREVMEHDRFAYDVDGPSAMTVFRLEKGEVRVLHLVNDISHAFLIEDYEMAEALIT